jgi:hypothetical protein
MVFLMMLWIEIVMAMGVMADIPLGFEMEFLMWPLKVA